VSTLILRTTARALTPAVLALALFFLIRGHDAPGGGFIAGLVIGAGIVLRWLAFGVDRLSPLVPAEPLVIVGCGLGIAVASGIVPMLFGGAFLSGTVWELEAASLELKVASSIVFDLGVTFVVVGMVGAFVRSLGGVR
jgi:multisubunit Na+/H+ antiporter MnhB subunit